MREPPARACAGRSDASEYTGESVRLCQQLIEDGLMGREQGVVVKVEAGVAQVTLVREKEGGCHSCAGCGGVCTATSNQFSAPAPEGLQAGDEVTIDIPGPGVGLSAALVLLVPVVVFVAGLALADLLQNRELLPDGDGVAVLVGLGLIVCWFAGLSVYDRRLRNDPAHQPKIVEYHRPATG